MGGLLHTVKAVSEKLKPPDVLRIFYLCSISTISQKSAVTGVTLGGGGLWNSAYLGELCKLSGQLPWPLLCVNHPVFIRGD